MTKQPAEGPGAGGVRDHTASGLQDRLDSAVGDRYTIERELGRCGGAIVYLAEDRKHQRRVAIKLLNPELGQALGAERFLREIEIAARLPGRAAPAEASSAMSAIVRDCMRRRAIIPLLVAALASGVGRPAHGQTPIDWPIHSMSRPQPPVIDPGPFTASAPPPSDAIVLFNGRSLDSWRSGDGARDPARWRVRDDYLEVAAGTGNVLIEIGSCALLIREGILNDALIALR